MFSKLKIATRIYLMGGLQLLLMLLMGGMAILQMTKIGHELTTIATKDIPLSNFLTQITEHQIEQAVLFERTLFYTSLAKQGVADSQNEASGVKIKWSELATKIEKELSETKKFVSEALKSIDDDKTKNEFINVLAALKKAEEHYRKVKEFSELMFEQSSQASLVQLSEQAHKVEALGDDVKDELVAIQMRIQNFTLEATLKAEQDEKEGLNWIIAMLVIALAFDLVVPRIIGQSITKPIVTLSDRLREIAEGDGDLTVSLDESGKDETADVASSFNRFLKVLRTMIGNTNQQAQELGNSSEIALSVMQKTAEDVNKQRLETEMVATAVTQMSTTTQEVALNTAQAADATMKVRDRVVSGERVANETQEIMKQLAEQVTESSNVIESLVAETNNIGSVLTSIQGIAEQTNLLALNAAIEAARAGESGRGFAVVADEVRSLAQRTQTSTVDIQDLLVRLQAEANNAVSSMSKGSESTEICLKKSAQTSQTFKDAAEAVQEISDLNVQIAAAAEEQSSVAEEINRNLINISQLADDTAHGAQETKDANKNIAMRVIDLHTNLNKFVI